MIDIKLLENVPKGSEFVLSNGRTLKNLYELTNALNSIDNATFSHHVTKERNDFSNWILHVFQNEALAKKISRLKNRKVILKTINRALSEINKEKPETKTKKKKVKAIIDESKKQEAKKEVKSIIVKPKKKKIKKAEVKKPRKEKSKSNKSERKYSKEILEKVDEILLRELQILKKEEKIEEIELDLEEKLKLVKNHSTGSHEFFSKEFVQGIAAGFLITLIITLVYVKFIAI